MKKLFWFFIIATMLLASGCRNKIEAGDDTSDYVLTTGDSDNITNSSARIFGKVVSWGLTIGEVGFVYDKAGQLNTGSSPRESTLPVDDGQFWVTLKGLEDDTAYEYVAFAFLDGKEAFGNTRSFHTNSVEVSSISLNKTSLTFTLGDYVQEQLTATVLPPNATDKSVEWSSSNPSVATVDPSGLVKAVSEGKANITVKTHSGGKTATCSVTVTKVLPSSITISPATKIIRMKDGKTVQLTATVLPANAADKSVTWSCYESDASVTSSGFVTVKRSGVFNITARSNAAPTVTGECTLTVIDVPPTAGVDLGLSVKWAPFDLGATANAPATGIRFAWGETEPKTPPYTSDTYKYTSDPATLPLSADAARVNWGGTWRMPTQSEVNDLLTKCTWTRVGTLWKYTVTGPNGKSIEVLYGSGYLWDRLYGDGEGMFWTSTRNTSSSYKDAYYMHISNYVREQSGTAPRTGIYGVRPLGMHIRPVCN